MQKKFDQSLKVEFPLLLAVSGGADSMVMAELFLHSSLKPKFAIAHCNFSLRGEDSNADEDLVEAWAKTNNIRFFKQRFNTIVYAQEKSLSIEMAARELRYSWFNDLAQEYGFKTLATAHNANDNAETLFLNLLRGTGVRGLVGMSLCSRAPYSENLVLFRPMLTFTRKQIEGYAFKHKVKFRDDRTNAESEYKRNRIRNEVFPIFSKINPSFIRTVNTEMQYFSQAENILSKYYEANISKCSTKLQDGLSIALEQLLALEDWEYILYRALEPYGFNSSVISSLEDLLKSKKTKAGKQFFAEEYMLYLSSSALIVQAIEAGVQKEVELEVTEPATLSIAGIKLNISVEAWSHDKSLKQAEGEQIFDANKLKFPFIIRKWKEGDWLRPLGMRGKKKVSDLFIDCKLDLEQKKRALILDAQEEASRVAAVIGLRIDDKYKVEASTKNIIRIKIT